MVENVKLKRLKILFQCKHAYTNTNVCIKSQMCSCIWTYSCSPLHIYRSTQGQQGSGQRNLQEQYPLSSDGTTTCRFINHGSLLINSTTCSSYYKKLQCNWIQMCVWNLPHTLFQNLFNKLGFGLFKVLSQAVSPEEIIVQCFNTVSYTQRQCTACTNIRESDQCDSQK